MPLKLTVGISKKVGQPNYGSFGASCNVEVELDQSLLYDAPEALQERVSNAYVACRQAVNKELARQQTPACDSTQTVGCTAADQSSDAPANGHNGHRATQKQIDYAQQLAGQIRGLGVRRLEDLVLRTFDKPLADLSSLDASGLIDMLKEVKCGKVELQTALDGTET